MPKTHARSLPDLKSGQTGIQAQWKQSLNLIKEDISVQGFRTWLSPIIPVSHVDNNLILRVPSQFFFEWLESNYQESIEKAVKKIFGLRTKIEYLVASSPDKQPEEMNLDEEPSSQKTERPVAEEAEEPIPLDARYQFENFVVKNDNELALRAAQAVAGHPGKTDYNPLLIYGDSGCGKTHLLNAIGNHVLAHRKRKKVLYLSSENFLNEYIYALQHKTMELFQKKTQGIDVLLLDDIQFLSNKKKSQEGLFFFFSEMERRRKQIVIALNQPPAQLLGFEDRLLSFFQKGLIVDLIPPSYDSRLELMDAFCAKNDLKMLPEVREFLAENLHDGLHQMRAVMVRIAAHGSLLNKPVPLGNVKRLLAQIDAKWAKRNGNYRHIHPIKIEQVIKIVSEYMNIPCDMLIGYSRQREISYARQIAIYLSKEISGESLQVIGYHFQNRHYTAILHNYKKIVKELKSNPVLNNAINEIKERIFSSRTNG